MAPSIEPYKRMLIQTETQLALGLSTAKLSLGELALLRVTTENMRKQLTTDPKSVLVFDVLPPDSHGFRGPEHWLAKQMLVADQIIHPHFMSEEEYGKKFRQYLDLSLEMINWGQRDPQVIQDKQAGLSYLIMGAHPLVRKIMELIASEFLKWFNDQPNDSSLFAKTPREGLAAMLTERQDLAALLRISQQLPLDVEVREIPIESKAGEAAIELAIGLIPVVGSMVAAYEVLSGRDLFGNQLSDLERGILGASILLPAAGRLAKGGRALYSEARLVRLYGQDARAWSRAVGVSGLSAAERQALVTVERAELAIAKDGMLVGALAKESAAVVPTLSRGGTALNRQVDQAVVDLFRELGQAHPELRTLDNFALERILAKGPNPDHIKGQLLEELVESRVVPWLRSREGAFALGVTVPPGAKLEFIPGHVIRDAAGRQISDGILAYRRKTDLVIVAVFEAKAGKSAARELSFARTSLSGLTDAQRAELRAFSTEVFNEQRAIAAAEGKAFTKKIEDVEREVMLSEAGGQVRRDIERLAPNVDGLARIRVGTEILPVQFSPTKTKFFGVLPKDVRLDTIERQLTENKAFFEMIGVEMKAGDLKKVADRVQKVIEQRLPTPPVPTPPPTPVPTK